MDADDPAHGPLADVDTGSDEVGAPVPPWVVLVVFALLVGIVVFLAVL